MVKRIFRALIRLNYSEWDYNHHLGGDSLQSLVFGCNNIFNFDESASEVDFEEAFLLLEDIWYPEDSNLISLGGGYWDGGVLAGLRDRLDSSAIEILRRSFRSNYFELEGDVLGLIAPIREDITREIPIGTQYSRARLGVKDRLKISGAYGDWNANYYYLPFSQVEIGRPPVVKVTEGRLNRPRVSILYLASDPLTAVAELRPHPGHLVSTAKFATLRSLQIADLSRHDIRNFLSDERLEDLRRILSLSAVINLPIQPEQGELYLITQLFSDCFRKAGYEGLAFRSSLGPGINLACFVPEALAQVPDSETVLEVSTLQYQLCL